MDNPIEIDNEKLIKKFGAHEIENLSQAPNFYTFQTGVLASHRDLDKFLLALKKGEKCAILSGVNASGSLHLGHKAVFDTNLFFQKKYNLPVFIPISDDESYLSGKISSQEEALENAKQLAKELIAYGFNPKKTFFIIDQIYTNIYNLAIKLSKKITLSEVKATYGYKNDDNPGLYFYPAVQAAHILFPQVKKGIKNVLVPIGPDEDAHARIARDIAPRFNYNKSAILHSKFLPGIDGKKMSKSKNNAIFLNDSEKEIKKKINKAFSGGQKTIQEHKEKGGNPDVDVSFIYLKNLFLSENESKKIYKDYKSGKLLTGELKALFTKHVLKFMKEFQDNLKKVKQKDVDKAILVNS
ncbi:tryptophan--tRNA ligase [Candidatus Pacearchaeota archaeon CG10_big_fil_rev_8_21_14_0_10_35_219]|nr:MAG: tryptophan--tRNA ligase [Candidatus Pacearchaeota archaeon CG10_big_fil_rev_8_21_14_0_10_35_219]